jgi:hypothetical protein
MPGLQTGYEEALQEPAPADVILRSLDVKISQPIVLVVSQTLLFSAEIVWRWEDESRLRFNNISTFYWGA